MSDIVSESLTTTLASRNRVAQRVADESRATVSASRSRASRHNHNLNIKRKGRKRLTTGRKKKAYVRAIFFGAGIQIFSAILALLFAAWLLIASAVLAGLALAGVFA